MANKSLGNRQKLVFRVTATQSKPRNPVAVAAKLRAAGPHRPSTSSLRSQQKRLLKKTPIDSEE
jgi:hypothetical protein